MILIIRLGLGWGPSSEWGRGRRDGRKVMGR